MTTQDLADSLDAIDEVYSDAIDELLTQATAARIAAIDAWKANQIESIVDAPPGERTSGPEAITRKTGEA
jgi:hypothetical protein